MSTSTDELLDLMLEYDDAYCDCGAIHDDEELADTGALGTCKSCGKIVD